MSRVRRYSRSGLTAVHRRSPTGLSPSAMTRSSGLRLTRVRAARRLPPPPAHSSNPPQASPAGCTARGVWAPPRSLAATKGILSVPRGTEMFQFPRCPPRIAPGCPAVRRAGCPMRKPPDRRLPAPPRGISPRGRVLPRPPTPRHPPCAHHANSCVPSHPAAVVAAAADRRAPEGRSLPVQPPLRGIRRRSTWMAPVSAPAAPLSRTGHRSQEDRPGGSLVCVSDVAMQCARATRHEPLTRASLSPAAAEPIGFRVARCQGT
jgi:hypothetical protein